MDIEILAIIFLPALYFASEAFAATIHVIHRITITIVVNTHGGYLASSSNSYMFAFNYGPTINVRIEDDRVYYNNGCMRQFTINEHGGVAFGEEWGKTHRPWVAGQ